MPIRGIVFDKDGTLLDFHATWVPVNRAIALLAADGDSDLAARILTASGQDDVAGTVASGSLLAAGSNHQIAEFWQTFVPGKDIEAIVRLINGVGKSAAAYTAKPVPGLNRIISDVSSRGIKIGLATSDSYESARETLAPFGILDRFDFVCGYDSGFGLKPGAGMVLGFCEQTGCEPSEVCVVGDNSHDMEMAIAAKAGLRVGVLTGTSSHQELDPLVDHVLPSISELMALIDHHNSGEKM